MSYQQKCRSNHLYLEAVKALSSLAEERLSLDHETRLALDRARGAVEEFDVLRLSQPWIEEVRIWNVTRGKWWMPDGNGYIDSFSDAGLFELADAVKHTRDVVPLSLPNNAIVPLAWREIETKGGAQ